MGAFTEVTRAQINRIEAEDHTRQVWNLPPGGPIRFPLTTGGLPESQSIAKLDPPVKTAERSPGPTAVEPAGADRVKIAEEVLAEQVARLQAGDATVGDMDRWNRRVLTARIDAGQDRAEALRSFLETSRKVESIARAQFKQGAIPVAELNKAATDRSEAEEFARRFAKPPGQAAAGEPGDALLAKGDPLVKPADTTPKPKKPAAAVTTPPGSAAERLRIAEEAIGTLKKLVEAPNNKLAQGSLGQLNNQLQNWQGVADQARHELGGPDPGYLQALRALESRAARWRPRPRNGLMPARAASSTISTPSSRAVQAQEQVDRWAESERNRKLADTTAEPTALKVNPGANPGDGPKARAADGEAGAIGEPEPSRPRRLPKINPADAERDKAIEDALEKTTSITFPEGTTLDEVLATLRA